MRTQARMQSVINRCMSNVPFLYKVHLHPHGYAWTLGKTVQYFYAPR
jgi:hypothetical protein